MRIAPPFGGLPGDAIASHVDGPRDLSAVVLNLRDALGELPCGFDANLTELESQVRYLAPEQQRDHWDLLQAILEMHAPKGHALHEAAVRIFNGGTMSEIAEDPRDGAMARAVREEVERRLAPVITVEYVHTHRVEVPAEIYADKTDDEILEDFQAGDFDAVVHAATRGEGTVVARRIFAEQSDGAGDGDG